MNARRKAGIAAASLVAGTVAGIGIFTAGGTAFADPTAAQTPAASTPAQAPGTDASGTDATQTDGDRGPGGPGGTSSQDTAVTGDEAQKVMDAVAAKDSTVTIDSVRKDPDGSYDALGTKDGQPVMFEVSADLATISEGHGGMGGGRGGAPDGQGPDGQATDGQAGTAPADGTAPTTAPTDQPQ